MTAPWIGGESESWRIGLCGFAPEPGGPHCARDATWHGVKIAEPDLKGMPTCNDHLPLVRRLADYVHPLVHPCCLPDALFSEPENRCYTEWDDAEFAAAAASVSAGAS